MTWMSKHWFQLISCIVFACSLVLHNLFLCACIHNIYTQDWLFPSASVPELEVQRPLGVAPDADHALGGKLVKKSTRRGDLSDHRRDDRDLYRWTFGETWRGLINLWSKRVWVDTMCRKPTAGGMRIEPKHLEIIMHETCLHQIENCTSHKSVYPLHTRFAPIPGPSPLRRVPGYFSASIIPAVKWKMIKDPPRH